jgi:hypothetical protein
MKANLNLSSDKEQSTKQIEQRDQLSMQARRIPVFISEPMVIEILAEVIRQSKRHLRADQLASALAIRGLPISEKEVMRVFDQYDIEKKMRIHIYSIPKIMYLSAGMAFLSGRIICPDSDGQI